MRTIKKAIFLDFDHTLFDSDLFFHVEVWDEVAKLGIPREVWDRTYENVWESGYSLHRHMRELAQFIPKESLHKIDELVHDKFSDLSRFLFPDVVNFLACIPRDIYDVHLLSFGHPEWQVYKVNGSGLIKYFDGLFFTLSYKERKIHKIEHLLRAYESCIMVDNSPRELDAVIDEKLSCRTYFMNRVPEDYRAKNAAEHRRFFEAVKYLRDEHMHEHQTCRTLDEIKMI